MIRSVDGKPELSKLVPNDARQPQQTSHEKPAATQQGDSIELSDRARQLMRNPELAKRQRIEAGIESDFYNSPEVLNTVAQRLLRDLDSGAASGV